MRCMSQQLALPGIAGEAAIRPLEGQRRFSVRQCTDPTGGVADSLAGARGSQGGVPGGAGPSCALCIQSILRSSALTIKRNVRSESLTEMFRI